MSFWVGRGGRGICKTSSLALFNVAHLTELSVSEALKLYQLKI